MKILIHSSSGDIGGLAYMMKKEGASVDLFVKDSFARKVMDGLVPHVETMEEGLKKKPDFVLFDVNGDGKLADKIRKDGFKVIGGSSFADKLEFDRAYGAKVAKQYGIACPETTEFKNVEEAMAFVKKNNKAYAIKMDSNAGGEGASYVANDAADMIDYLQQQKESGKIDGNTFIVQEKIDGSEVSTECWFSDGSPCFPSNSTWETKKLLAGELGVRTGCETSLVCHYEGDRAKLPDQTVLRLAPLLKYARYTGAFDVNAIVSEKDRKPYFLEFTPRFGYSAIYAYAAMLGMPVSQYLYQIVMRGTLKIPFKAKWSTALKVHIPPYPFTHDDDRVEREAYKPTESIRIKSKSTDFIPIDVKKGKKTEFETAGTMGIVGECLGRGDSIMSAWRASQKVFEDVKVPNKGGRLTDGIEDAWKRISKLRSWGFTDIPAPSSGQISPGAKVTKPLSSSALGG